MPDKIAHADFLRTATGFFGLSDNSFEDVVAQANDWVAEKKVSVINVETLQAVTGGGGITSTTERGLRVWFWAPEPNAK